MEYEETVALIKKHLGSMTPDWIVDNTINLLTEFLCSGPMMKLDITDPTREVYDGDILYNDEYVVASLMVNSLHDNSIVDSSYNFYVDDEKINIKRGE